MSTITITDDIVQVDIIQAPVLINYGGPKGDTGDQGPPGPQGPKGGSVAIFPFRASNLTQAADPGTGRIRWNNATQVSATELYLDRLDNDGLDVQYIFNKLLPGYQIYIQDEDLGPNYQRFNLISYESRPDWFILHVSFVEGGGAMSMVNNQGVVVIVIPIGPTGPGGAGVPPGGTAGQVLAKIDGSNYNTQWVDP